MPNVKIQMPNQVQNLNAKKYDLEERTARFGEQVWLRMIAKANPYKAHEARELWKEANELTPIFSAIIRSK